MNAILDFVKSIWNDIIVLIFSSNNILFDLLDIAIVTFIIYKVVQYIRQTRAQQLIQGLLVFFVAYVVAQWLNLKALMWIMSMVYLNLIVVVVILFQPELRSLLEKIGRSGNIRNLSKGILGGEENDDKPRQISEICSACAYMSRLKIGALMVFERDTRLNDIVASGTVTDAKITNSLICNIFFKNSPLHDGAMIISDGRIKAASCILPLTQDVEVDPGLGTRHRAALGMSESSDAIVVIVSEETGVISVAQNGAITRGYTLETLKELLTKEFIGDETDQNKKSKIMSLIRKGDASNEK